MDAREYLVPIPPLERWKRDMAARPTPFTDGLCADAPEEMCIRDRDSID